MSNISAIGLIMGTGIALFVGVNYVVKIANERLDEVVTGVVKGMPVSAKHRSIMFYNEWLPTMSSLSAFSLLAALLYLGIAREMSSVEVRWLAYIVAGFMGWASIMFLIFGASSMLHCVSVLRETKRD